jgi:arginine decarboxylase
VDRLENGTITTRLFADEQGKEGMMTILGYGEKEDKEEKFFILSQDEMALAENLSLVEQ